MLHQFDVMYASLSRILDVLNKGKKKHKDHLSIASSEQIGKSIGSDVVITE